MKILVLSEHDDGCGPMAAAFLRDFSTKLEVVSAGRHPGNACPALVVRAMRECLIDLEGYVPKALSTVEVEDFDAVYECPDLPCPSTLEACRQWRDFIKNDAFLFFRSRGLTTPGHREGTPTGCRSSSLSPAVCIETKKAAP